METSLIHSIQNSDEYKKPRSFYVLDPSPYKGGRSDRGDFTNWMSFLPSKTLWKRSTLIQKFSAHIPKAFHSRGIDMENWAKMD